MKNGEQEYRIICGDVLEGLKSLADESVNCVVTSPPYWGLRDYGTATWSGGRSNCKHVRNHGVQGSGGQRATRTFTAQAVYKDACRKCGAIRIDQQLGLEKTYQEYIAKMVVIFREVRRVLRKDGTIWVNMGDTYNNCDKWGGGGVNTGKHTKSPDGTIPSWAGVRRRWSAIDGLKPKDLVGIPWRLAFALQDDGWWLRSDIIWAKTNPMPESVKDRPTKAHEYLFLLAKSERYYYDAEAIKEPASPDTHARTRKLRATGAESSAPTNQRNGIRAIRPAGVGPKGSAAGSGIRYNESFSAAVTQVLDFRNKRSVWTVNTQAFPGAHFATFPEKLIEPCILAGCPRGGLVLDPFAGSGTTGVVALRHGRQFVALELNPEYVEMAHRRILKSQEPTAVTRRPRRAGKSHSMGCRQTEGLQDLPESSESQNKKVVRG